MLRSSWSSKQTAVSFKRKEHQIRAFEMIVLAADTEQRTETAILSSTSILQTTVIALSGTTAAVAYIVL